MTDRVPRTRLRSARLRLGWSKERAADEVARRYPHLAMDARQIGRWESGETKTPRPMNVLALSATYGLPPEELDLPPLPGASPADLSWTSPRAAQVPEPGPPVRYRDGLVVSAGSLHPGGADIAAPSPPSIREKDDDLERRLLLELIGGALALPLTGRLEDLRRKVESALNPVVTAQEVEESERLADDYSRMVGYLPPEQFLPDLLIDLDEVRVRLINSPDQLRARLVRVSAQMSALIAITLQTQIGDASNSARYWRTALRVVDQAGDPGLRSLVRGHHAIFALYDQRRSASVLTLAEDTIRAAAGIPCAGVAMGHAARAQALAQLGRHDEAREALHTLVDVFTRLPDSVRSLRVGQWGWSEHRLRFVESYVHSYAGRLSDAVRAQDAALALYPPLSYQGPAQVQLHRATCLIIAGDPSEGARQTIRTLVALPQGQRHDALVHRTAALAIDLIPNEARDLPAVAEARERVALASQSP